MSAAGPPALADNLVGFGRLLRAAGLPVGSDRILDAVRSAECVGPASREDLYWALAAVLVSRREEQPIFDRAFRRFFRDHDLRPLLPGPRPRRRAPGREPRADAALTASDRERLGRVDFAAMDEDDLRRAERLVARIPLAVAELRSRRLRPDPHGRRVDLRAALRAGLRGGGAGIPLRWREPGRRPARLVVLCDVSGSMERYSRVLLHFLHALARRRRRVEVFLFATRLTRVSRVLGGSDPDAGLVRLAERVRDWSGGTRIAASLREFNRRWSRRLLSQGAWVLLVSDGLERDATPGLAAEASRLRRSCRRLVWLNPLLGYAGFEPRAAGIRALLPHVDEFRPVHDLQSLEDLARALARAS